VASISRWRQQLLLRYQVQFFRFVTGLGARLLKKEQYRSGTELEALTEVSAARVGETWRDRKRRGMRRKKEEETLMMSGSAVAEPNPRKALCRR